MNEVPVAQPEQIATTPPLSKRADPLRRWSAGHKEELLRGAEHMGVALALLTWVVFGGIVVPRMIERVTWPAVLCAVLSVTAVRMLPVFLCLIGTQTSAADNLFIGWFDPGGLATIVFAVPVLHAKLPGNDTMMLAAGWTVILSIIAHGLRANPLVKAKASRRQRVKWFPQPLPARTNFG
jgi:NhaP-type Na+/H+ or K+/H+ antiporter